MFGPIIFGPASETFGRRIPLFSGYILFAIFQIPVAVAQNLETIMLGRFFGGFFASAPLAVVGGALADIWDPLDRAYGVCAFAAGAFAGPVAGPIMGGFIVGLHVPHRNCSNLIHLPDSILSGLALDRMDYVDHGSSLRWHWCHLDSRDLCRKDSANPREEFAVRDKELGIAFQSRRNTDRC